MPVVIYDSSDFNNQNEEKIYRAIVNTTVPNADTITLHITPAPNATFADAQASLATDLQAALRLIPSKAIIDISQDIIWNGATYQGWANITYNP